MNLLITLFMGIISKKVNMFRYKNLVNLIQNNFLYLK
jgi:hypothetical protein